MLLSLLEKLSFNGANCRINYDITNGYCSESLVFLSYIAFVSSRRLSYNKKEIEAY